MGARSCEGDGVEHQGDLEELVVDGDDLSIRYTCMKLSKNENIILK